MKRDENSKINTVQAIYNPIKVTRAVTVKAETQLITRRRTHLHGFVVNDYDGIEYRIITKL